MFVLGARSFTANAGGARASRHPIRRAKKRRHVDTASGSQFRPVHIARTVIRSPTHVRRAVAPGPVFWLRTFARSPSHPGSRQDSGIRSVDGYVHYSGASASESHRLPYMMLALTPRITGKLPPKSTGHPKARQEIVQVAGERFTFSRSEDSGTDGDGTS